MVKHPTLECATYVSFVSLSTIVKRRLSAAWKPHRAVRGNEAEHFYLADPLCLGGRFGAGSSSSCRSVLFSCLFVFRLHLTSDSTMTCGVTITIYSSM